MKIMKKISIVIGETQKKETHSFKTKIIKKKTMRENTHKKQDRKKYNNNNRDQVFYGFMRCLFD